MGVKRNCLSGLREVGRVDFNGHSNGDLSSTMGPDDGDITCHNWDGFISQVYLISVRFIKIDQICIKIRANVAKI